MKKPAEMSFKQYCEIPKDRFLVQVPLYASPHPQSDITWVHPRMLGWVGLGWLHDKIIANC